ncbi:hypothetical protein [Nonomuraea sp. NPDC003709]|uniref:hypothetical protein n=1 Tax=Nonomuraea sp. NPDC003709 TaxID=3154450 RepID=UPI0033B00968
MRLVIALMLWLNPLPFEIQPRFPASFDLCATVDRDLVERLVPDAETSLDGSYCVWRRPGTNLTVRWANENGEHWDYTSAQAHEEYRRSLIGDLRPDPSRTAWINSRSRELSTTQAQAIAGVGSEAYLVDHLSKSTKQVELVTVLFRTGNLLIEIEYAAADRVRHGAVSVSRRVAAALDRMSPPEPTPTPPPGTYAEPPIACALLSPEQTKKLVDPDTYARAWQNSADCSWEKPNTSFDAQLELRFWAPQRGPAGDGVAQAKEMFSGWREPESAPLDITDEALAFRTGTPRQPGEPVVVFRKANLIGYVQARDPAQAEQAARWIVEALS